MVLESCWDTESVGDQETDQRAPEHDVQHHGRSDALGAQSEPSISLGDPRLGQQSESERRPWCRTSGRDVTEGEGGQVDPEESQSRGSLSGEHRVRELRIGR